MPALLATPDSLLLAMTVSLCYRYMNEHRFQFLLLILTKLDHLEGDEAQNTQLRTLHAVMSVGPQPRLAGETTKRQLESQITTPASLALPHFVLLLQLALSYCQRVEPLLRLPSRRRRQTRHCRCTRRKVSTTPPWLHQLVRALHSANRALGEETRISNPKF